MPAAAAVRPGYLAYKDMTSATNKRTMIAALIPMSACRQLRSADVDRSRAFAAQSCCLLANLNTVALDFVGRQKVGGVHLNFFIVEQLPIFPPDRYAEAARGTSGGRWRSGFRIGC